MRKLSDLSLDEYVVLNNMGMLYEFWPEATGNFINDCRSDKSEYYSFSHSNGEERIEMKFPADNYSVEEVVTAFFEFYKACGFVNDLDIIVRGGNGEIKMLLET